MKKFSIWHWGLMFLSMAVIALLGIGFASAVENKGIGSGEAASWLQAIGSIIAIVAAFMIASRQHAAERALEADRQRLNDIRRLRAVKAVLAQICMLSNALHKIIKARDADELYDFDPQFLDDYKGVLQSLPLFEIPSGRMVLFVNLIPRAIHEVTVRLFGARKQENHPVLRYEWLLAFDIEERVEKLCDVAATANSECFDEIDSMGGISAEERVAFKPE